MIGSIRKSCAALGLAASLFALSTAASAGCLQNLENEPAFQQESWRGSDAGAPRLMPIDWRERHLDDIVGFWNIVVTFNGQVIDYGLQQWHSDGTEMTNSEMQPPLTQNYCLGVWEKTGPSSYKLNHFAYTYDTKQNPTGLVRILFDVTVKDGGDVFSGTYTITFYDTFRNQGQTIPAKIVGKRITVDTSPQQIH